MRLAHGGFRSLSDVEEGVPAYLSAKRQRHAFWRPPMENDLNTVNFAEIEARARLMRAEAARDGFISFRNALANAFAALTFRGTKAA